MIVYYFRLVGKDKKKKRRYRSKKWFLNFWDVVSVFFLMYDVIYWNDLFYYNRFKLKFLESVVTGLESKIWVSFGYYLNF